MKQLFNISALILAITIFTGIAAAQPAAPNGNKANTQYKGQDGVQSNWIDANGDGICDNFGTENQRNNKFSKRYKMNRRNGGLSGLGFGNGYGFGDGSGIRPQDGSGFGTGNGRGICDGTGPKGKSNRRGKN